MRLGITAGRFAPGRQIVIADEARSLRLSPTPVREALCWLGGEGLVERGAAGGFFAPRFDHALIAKQYALRMQCLLQAEEGCAHPPPVELTAEPSLVDRLRAVWRWRVRSFGDGALVDVFERVEVRLSRFQAAEHRLFEDVEAEAQALLARPLGGGRDLIVAYHERRMASAPSIALNAARDGASGAGA
ncbi:hypothetical protein LTR94_026344 [Friedmanniomyces endolithicus]|nr:hypothetical protein LTR94_026344 [Friedmanniomyces endolithicus]